MHKITIQNIDNAEKLLNFHGLKKQICDAGEKVEFFVLTGTDTDYRVTSEQVAVHCDEYIPGGCSRYSFVMPDMDVEIDVTVRESMLYTGPGSPMVGGPGQKTDGIAVMGMMNMGIPAMGMMNMGMMNMGMANVDVPNELMRNIQTGPVAFGLGNPDDPVPVPAAVASTAIGADDPNIPDPYPWEGKPKFCSECGASTKGAKKFCGSCGKPLFSD